MSAHRPPIVFLGPTLAHSAAAKICAAEFRPPAGMGDITRAVCDGPETIVLIDGVFEAGPSAWHKEILWALSKGIGVIGAASMGALRAAELDGHGMLGHGEIYRAYASGELQDDDEVAVVHGPAETGFMPLTDAMVDMRDAISQAESSNVLTVEEAAATTSSAKELYFKARYLNQVLQTVLQQTRTEGEIRRILEWFAGRPVGAKTRDAHDLLANLTLFAEEAGTLARRRAPPFVPTVYLSRLEPFGYRNSIGAV